MTSTPGTDVPSMRGTATMPPADMFWGDRYGQLKDPFGVTWALNTPIKK
jgi:PhnB protein